MSKPRRFPPLWTIDEMNNACFIVRDKNGQQELPRKSMPNSGKSLPPRPVDPRLCAERRHAAMEVGTAVTNPDEVGDVCIRCRCETS